MDGEGVGMAPDPATDAGVVETSSGTDQTTEAAKPTPEHVKDVVEGIEIITKLTEAAAIVADAEAVVVIAEPLGGFMTVVVMAWNVLDALETPERTCAYQGLCYGLMYAVLGMGDPEPNPGWPGADAAPEGGQRFRDGVAEAKRRLADGQEGVKRNNLLLLAIAKDGPKAVINRLWQSAVSDSDHLLRMFTIEWPEVGPNG